MTITSPSSLFRLFAQGQRVALAAALVAASAQVATAAPLTASYGFSLGNSTIAAFNTNLGTLLGIDITLDAGLSAINPLSDAGSAVGTCMASFVGGSYTVSAPGGSPTLLSLTGDGTVNFACGQFEVALTKHAAVSLGSSLFGTFSSAGFSPLTLVQTTVGAGGLIVRGAGSAIADGIWDPRLTSGTVQYTYCPVGDICTADPPPTTVPEPATATMLALGLAGLVARRRAALRRATLAMPIAVLGLLALAPAPAAATAMTYDFSGTFEHGPSSDPTNTAITGQFTIDFTSQTITTFDFQTPSGHVTPSNWFSQIFVFTPAVSPVDNFVLLSFFNGDGTLALVFRTTLGAFDGSTFYTGLVEIDGGGTASGMECRYEGPICTPYFGSPFVSAAAAPHTDPPPPVVPEPTTMALVGAGLVALAGRFTWRPSRHADQ